MVSHFIHDPIALILQHIFILKIYSFSYDCGVSEFWLNYLIWKKVLIKIFSKIKTWELYNSLISTWVMSHFNIVRFFIVIISSKSSFAFIWNFKGIAYPYLPTDFKNAHNVCKTQSIANDYPEFKIIFKTLGYLTLKTC